MKTLSPQITSTSRRFLDPIAVRKLKRLDLIARVVVEGFMAGVHRSPHRGFSVEFTEHREYSPGDDLRHVDWKVWARTDRHYIKLYEQETNLRCYLLLDVSASMGYASDGMSKLEYASYLAACLSYLMVRQQDTVGLVAFSNEIVETLTPKNTRRHLYSLLTVLDGLRAQGTTGIAEPLRQLAQNVKRRGLMVIISDLLDEPDDVLLAVKHLRHQGHEVIVFHILDRDEREFPFVGQVAFEDMESGEVVHADARLTREAYLRKLNDWMERYRLETHASRAHYVPVDTSVPFDHVLTAYLSRRAKV